MSRRQKRSSWLSSAEGDDSPQCGEMSRRDKRARHPLKMGDKLSPLTRGIDYTVLKSKRNKQAAVRHLENKKTSSKL